MNTEEEGQMHILFKNEIGPTKQKLYELQPSSVNSRKFGGGVKWGFNIFGCRMSYVELVFRLGT